MSSFTITTVSVLPVTLTASTMYLVKSEENDLLEVYVTNKDASEIRHIINKTNIVDTINNIIHEVIGSSLSIGLIADNSLVKNKVIKATNTGCSYASSSSLADIGKISGILSEDVQQGQLAKVLSSGVIEDTSFNFNIGPVYLGIDGVLTQTLPVSGFLQQIGIAVESTKLELQIQPPIKLG